MKLGSILLIWGAVGERGLQRVLSSLHGVPSVPWRSLSSATRDAIRMLPAEQAFRLNAVPYAAYQHVIGVAFASPSSDTIAQVGTTTGMKVLPAVAPDVRILQAHQRFYGRPIDAKLGALISQWKVEPEDSLVREDAEGALQPGAELNQLASASPGPRRRPGGVADTRQVRIVQEHEESDDEADRESLSRFVAEALHEFERRSLVVLRVRDPESEAASSPEEASDSAPAPQRELNQSE